MPQVQGLGQRELESPFPPSGAVTNRNFVGREAELSRILGLIDSGGDVLIRDKEGTGKTSLVSEFARRNEKDFVFIYIDAYGVTNQTQLLQKIATESINTCRRPDGTVDPAGWQTLRSTTLKLAVLQREILTTSAIDEIRTLAPPKKKDAAPMPKSTVKTEIRMCPDCGRPLKWIPKYARHYCYSCKKYLPRQRRMTGLVDERNDGVDTTCPTCGSDTVFNGRYAHYYCSKCHKYPFVHLRRREMEEFTTADAIEALELPQKIAVQMGAEFVVILDEFQNAASFGSTRFLTTMRMTFEYHTQVHYILVTTEGQAAQYLLDGATAPFNKFANTLRLQPIPAERMEKFLMARFASGGGRLPRHLARKIAELSGEFPGHAQLIGHELFDISKQPTQEDLDVAISMAIERQSRTYRTLWENIHSPLQRRFLIACVTEPLAAHGSEFVHRYGLKSRSHLQRCETQLEGRGVIRDGEVVDPLFVLWLRSITERA